MCSALGTVSGEGHGSRKEVEDYLTIQYILAYCNFFIDIAGLFYKNLLKIEIRPIFKAFYIQKGFLCCKMDAGGGLII